MRKITIFLFVLVLSVSCGAVLALGEERVMTQDNIIIPDDWGHDIAVDPEGYVYVTGQLRWSYNTWDFYTIKYTPATLNRIWTVRYDGPNHGDDIARAIAVYGDGVYVTGESWNGTDFDYVTIKYDRITGDSVWCERFNGGNDDYPEDIAAVNNCLCVTGNSASDNLWDILSIKYDPETGTQDWVRFYDGTSGLNDYGMAVATDGEACYVTGGTTRLSGMDYITITYDCNTSSIDWWDFYDGGGVLNPFDLARAIVVDGDYVYVTGESGGLSTGQDYATIAYYKETGVRRWTLPSVARFDRGDDDIARAIVVRENAVYVTGDSKGANWDYTTVKYDAQGGSQVWSEVYDNGGEDSARGITVDDVAVYVTGVSQGNGSGMDYATVKYGLTRGGQQEVWRFNGTGNGYDAANAITSDQDRNVYVTGKSRSQTDYDCVTKRYSPNIYLVCPDGSGNFLTIQNAINSASDGDIIELCDTTFTGDGNWDIDFLGKAIIVRSKSGDPSRCVINCSDGATQHRGFLFHNNETSTSRLEGITITKGTYIEENGGGIYFSYSSPLLRNCRIIDCYSNYYGGGIYCESSSPTFESCTISGNDASSDGGGLFCYLSSPTFSYCIISGNNAFGSGGGLAFLASYSYINNCTFSGNNASYGGALLNNALDPTPSFVTISHSILWNDCASGQGDEIHNVRGGFNSPAVCSFYCCDVDPSKLSGSGEYVFTPPNINIDPMFCNPDTCVNAPTIKGIYCLRVNSPCLPDDQPVCGLIGALGVGILRGDCNGDGSIPNLGDVVYLISYVYKGGPAPIPLEAGDVNCTGGLPALGDVVYLIDYVYQGGPPPCYYCP